MTRSVPVALPRQSAAVRPVAASGRRFAVATLGCKVNSFESEHISQQLSDLGYTRVAEDAGADILIVNTCTVTAEAGRQARQRVRRMQRHNPAARIVVTGCHAEIDPEAWTDMPGVDMVVGNAAKLEIPALLAQPKADAGPQRIMRDLQRDISLPRELIRGFGGRARAFVQAQQGCDQGCTFCIIHIARGPNRSLPLQQVLRQCRELARNGYHEIVLCGVDIGSYGADAGDYALPDLVQEVAALPEDFRIRLSSIDPIHITDRLAGVMQSPKICPQLHLSLQSGNTLILKRMKRRAKRQQIYECINRLREYVPGLVLSADILVGFPTETEAQFADTLQIIDELDIAYPHVFPFSARSGTPAAQIPRQVPVAIRRQRARAARELGQRVWQRVAETQIGTHHRVIVETHARSTGKARARLANYFPVEFSLPRNSTNPAGKWAQVVITDVGDGILSGTPTEGLQDLSSV